MVRLMLSGQNLSTGAFNMRSYPKNRNADSFLTDSVWFSRSDFSGPKIGLATLPGCSVLIRLVFIVLGGWRYSFACLDR